MGQRIVIFSDVIKHHSSSQHTRQYLIWFDLG
jgi:hypothetical protein